LAATGLFAHMVDMRSDLSRMEKEHRVDSSFLKKINLVISEFGKLETYWVIQKDVALRTAFIIYTALRNARLVLERMRKRFEESTGKNENPKIVEDSAMVMPLIFEIYQKSKRATEEKRNLDPFMPNEMLKLLSTLRITAKATGLLPQTQDEMRGIDRERFRQSAVNLDKKLVAFNFVECT